MINLNSDQYEATRSTTPPITMTRIKLITSLLVAYLLVFSGSAYSSDEGSNKAFDLDAVIQNFFPGATVIGEPLKEVPIIPVYQLQELLGYVFESNDFVNIPGFSGKRVNMLIGMDIDGKLVGNRIIEHQEPIFLYGLGDPPLQTFIKQFIGPKVNNRVRIDGRAKASGTQTDNTVYIDGVSRATISVIVINDTILSASLKVARKMLDEYAQAAAAEAKLDYFEKLSWAELLDKGYVRSWKLSRKQVEEQLGSLENFGDDALDLSENEIEIYYAYINTPITGRNLLGDETFERLFNSYALKDKEHALLIASRGFYSYLENEFRPGSIPDRVSINQSGLSIPMRDVNFSDIPSLSTLPGAPDVSNMRIFKIKPQTGFNPSVPMELRLNVALRKNHLVRKNASFGDQYQLPIKFFNIFEIQEEIKEALWVSIWKSRIIQIAILLLALILVTLIFAKQDYFSKMGNKFAVFRWSFLFFTLIFIGYYTQGQLSVVNIFTVLIAAISDFDLSVFLLDPIIFILWSFTFITLFIWGRGVFCGWLCPFGVLQEIVAWFANKLSIKQWQISPRLHKVLSKVKYVILLGLIGVSFYSLGTAEVLSEVEPFKTAITMNFVRTWPFVVYSVLLLGVGLFVNKFYCRYVCPLGGGLAILGKFRRFELLTRRDECGKPCQTCRHACGVNAIEKSGEIDYDECIQCLECVVIIKDETRCSPQRVQLKKRGKQKIEEILIIQTPSAS